MSANNLMPSLTIKQLSEHYDYLAPDGSEIRLLPEVKGGGLAHCTLPTDGVSQTVAHKTVEEIWYFLQGQGEVWRKSDALEQVDRVFPGVCLTILAGTHFQFRNTGDEPLRILIATIPLWPGSQEAVLIPNHWPTNPASQC